MLQTVRLAYHPTLDRFCGFHGDDFCTEGEPEVLDQVDAMTTTRLETKILPRVGPGVLTVGKVLRKR